MRDFDEAKARGQPLSNGLGPWWFPGPVRACLTHLAGLFFREAAWEKHDLGYARGAPSRAICDRKFLCAMLRDASQCTTTSKVWACVWLAGFFWVMVRLFGWASYRKIAQKRL